jgi:hypothetical protein
MSFWTTGKDNVAVSRKQLMGQPTGSAAIMEGKELNQGTVYVE